MSIESYQGQSDRLLVEIKDANGTIIDPSAGALSDVRVYVVHRVTFEVVAKFAKVTATGYTVFDVVEEPASGDYKAECILDSSLTQEAQQGVYEVQVDLYLPDAKFEDGVQVIRQKGILMNLNPATNG
jgi:hypothetical protein